MVQKFVDFCKELKIPENQYKRRKPELLEWLKNFYEYEYFAQGHCYYIEIKEQFGQYQQLPRKEYNNELRAARIAEAKKDYEIYTRNSLGKEFKPNSKAKIARDAISEFGTQKYSHISTEWVASKYIKEPFDKYSETNNKHVWVACTSYEPLEDSILQEWRSILSHEHISEMEAANAFYRQEQGEDISKEKQYYKNALASFKQQYGYVPVLVREWKEKSNAETN